MIGEVCSHYGWTVDHVLEMPASRFFLMLESARKLRAEEFQRLCFVSRSAQMTNAAFEETVAFFGGIGSLEAKELPEKPKKPAPKPLKGADAGRAVMAAFAKDRRVNRMAPAKKKPVRPNA
jgi:hypothetical protein